MRKRKYHEVWSEYDDFIKSLHLDQEKEKDSSKIRSYLKKILIVFFASFFTTSSFHFFMEKNGIINSGINGIAQVISMYYFQKNLVNKYSFAFFYYMSVILVNISIILLTELAMPGNFWINSTAFFYAISQFIWGSIFQHLSLREYFFNKLNPETWSNLSSEGQLALTLPFYILIAAIASALHTYGYSFIYEAKSSPGGLDIVTSTLSQRDDKKNEKDRISIGGISKIFGFGVVFVITILNFILIENDTDLAVKKLIKNINESQSFNFKDIEIKNKEGLFHTLNSIKSDLEEQEKKIDHSEEDFEKTLRLEESLNEIKNFLDLEVDDDFDTIINYLKEGKGYLVKAYKKKISLYREKNLDRRKSIAKLNSPSTTQFESIDKKKNKENEKLEKLTRRLNYIKDKSYEKSFSGYLRYTTNNEKLWGSLVYILLSSYFINKLFPKNRIIKIYFVVHDQKELVELTNILKKNNTYYFDVIRTKEGFESECKILCCLITRWNYQLISDKLKSFEKVAIFETNEKS